MDVTDKSLSQSLSRPTEDAKDLLARLYREIGISAVAAALAVTAAKKPDDETRKDGPGRTQKDIAA